MFFRKNKRLFGNGIEPKCEYCANASGAGEKLRCAAGLENDASTPCPRFRYDPLRRAPETRPEIKKRPPEEFKL